MNVESANTTESFSPLPEGAEELGAQDVVGVLARASAGVDGPLAIQQLYMSSLSPLAQLEFKATIVALVAEWIPSQTNELLVQLAKTAALVRASGAVPHLVRYLADRRLERGREQEDSGVVHEVIRVIAGFAPLDSAFYGLKQLLHDPRYAPRFGPIIFNGLCACKPEAYEQHVLRLFTLADGEPGFTLGRPFWFEFLRVVGVAALFDGATRLTQDLRVRLFCELQTRPFPPAKIGIDASESCYIVNDATQVRVGYTPGSLEACKVLWESISAAENAPEVFESLEIVVERELAKAA